MASIDGNIKLYLIFVLKIRKQLEGIKLCEEVQGGREERYKEEEKRGTRRKRREVQGGREERYKEEEKRGETVRIKWREGQRKEANEQGFRFFLTGYVTPYCCLNISRHFERHRLVNFQGLGILDEQ